MPAWNINSNNLVKKLHAHGLQTWLHTHVKSYAPALTHLLNVGNKNKYFTNHLKFKKTPTIEGLQKFSNFQSNPYLQLEETATSELVWDFCTCKPGKQTEASITPLYYEALI